MSLSWLLLVSSAAAAAAAAAAGGCQTDEDCLLIRSPTAKPIRVGCVGDSITAGYLASPSSMAYPAQLQTQVRDRPCRVRKASWTGSQSQHSPPPFIY